MRVVVTGADQGLGLAIAQALSKDQHRVIAWNKDNVDVRDRQLVQSAAKKLGAIDALVNNAGVNRIDYLEKVLMVDWDNVMNTNARGIFYTSQALLPNLIDTRGVIVNIVSNAAHVPMTASLAYNASKGAAEIMTKQLARELTRRFGISVIGIAPNNLLGTGMSEDIEQETMRVRGWTLAETREYQRKSLLVGEPTPPYWVAELIAWLLSDRNRTKYLTGCIIPYGV